MPDHSDSTSQWPSIIELQRVDSTNNYARGLITAGSGGHGQGIFAYEQWGGKGQRDREWLSGKGENIIFTLVLNPYPLKVSEQFHLSACIAVSVLGFFAKYAGENTKIKWPNDLYWQDRKAGGVLIESVIGSLESKWKWAIVGIGININQTQFDQSLPNPVSLKQITGKDFNVLALTKELHGIIMRNFERLIKNGFDDFLKNYNTHLYKKDELVKLRKDNRVFEARIRSVSKEGKLLSEHGISDEFSFGEVEWLT